ncbi:MAG: hypothetical protein EA368_09005 [Leptolyngbya sp. DLM2.Bin27]|nr:MAG: hypothetical protein EA368_09005 [Leptolyngbya sp. DLM2.Bin27]
MLPKHICLKSFLSYRDGSLDFSGLHRVGVAGFACTLTVTHLPHGRAAFQPRIDVAQTAHGSQLSLSA